jgi:hypothetical protein
LKKDTEEILGALQKPPALKWALEMEIIKLGLMSWCDKDNSKELKSKILQCIDAEEFRSAMMGCMYLFGVGENEMAIQLSERIFEVAESSSDYEFNASSALSVLIDCSVQWEGAPNGKYYVSVEKNYLASTILSIADDFRQSDDLYNESRIVEMATGLSRAGRQDEAKKLLNEYLDKISEYSEIESFIYNFTRSVYGIPNGTRSIEEISCDFVGVDFIKHCFAKAKEVSKKSDKDSLGELLEYVAEY